MINQRGFYKKSGTTLWLHKDGRTYTISLKPEGSARQRGGAGAGAAANNGLLVSPMPGKIHKVTVKLNDEVKAGVTVCVIEAMKMEYALKAPFDGIVKQILKKEGDGVTLDEQLLLIEKKS